MVKVSWKAPTRHGRHAQDRVPGGDVVACVDGVPLSVPPCIRCGHGEAGMGWVPAEMDGNRDGIVVTCLSCGRTRRGPTPLLALHAWLTPEGDDREDTT